MTELLNVLLVLNLIAEVASLTIVSRSHHHSKSPGVYWYRIHAPDTFVSQRHQQKKHGLSPFSQYRIITIPKYHKRYRVESPRAVLHPIVVTQRRPMPAEIKVKPWPNPASNELEDEFPMENVFPPVKSEQSFSSFGGNHIRNHKTPSKLIASTPPPDSNGQNKSEIEALEEAFKPIQMYFQIRQTNQVRHVPRSEAIKDAASLEELLNAPRLKELLRTTRVREVYSEEGYEDAGYDHGGHIRHAEHEEAYAAKDQGLFNIKEEVNNEDYTFPVTKGESNKKVKDADKVPQGSKIIPKITMTRTEVNETSVNLAGAPSTYKRNRKYSSRIKSRPQEGDIKPTESSPSHFWVAPPANRNATDLEGTTTATIIKETSTNKPNSRSKYVKIATINDKLSNQKVSNMASKKLNQNNNLLKLTLPEFKSKEQSKLRFEMSLMTTSKPEASLKADEKIIMPTIGYINSLTTAHFGKDKNVSGGSDKTLTTPLNLTEALKYLRANGRDATKAKAKERGKHKSPVLDHSVENVPAFEPMKVRKESRKRRSLVEREDDEDDEDEEEEPHREKNAEIDEEERKRLEEERREQERYEEELREELEEEEREIIKKTLGKYGAEGDVDSAFEGFASSLMDAAGFSMEEPVDVKKYPFYYSQLVDENSPLKYASNPKDFPRKSGHGMEFYESRDKLIQCPESDDLDDLPKTTAASETETDKKPRISSLGSRIDCLKKKYFGEDPLDSPFFKETKVGYFESGFQKNNSFVENMKYKPETKAPRPNVKPRHEPTSERVIPVTEPSEETLLPQYTITYINKDVGDRRKLTNPRKPSSEGSFLILNSCPPITGKADRSKDLAFDCKDAILVQMPEAKPSRRPKTQGKGKVDQRKFVPSIADESSDWIPIVGYPRPSRKIDDEYYLITDLTEEKDVRRGEVVEPKRKRAVVEDLTNWSLRDFLADRWGVNLSAQPKRGSRYLKGNDGTEMIYARQDPAHVGTWFLLRTPRKPKL